MSFGYLAPTFGQFGHGEARFFSIGPSISWAAFDLGRVRARISSARAETDAALSSYEGAVLNALEDTEGALVSYGRSQSRRESLAAAAAASDKAADLARKRFEGGLIDFLEVLDAERTALSAELVFSQSRTDAATSLIAVYKALGAGWDLPGPDPDRAVATHLPVGFPLGICCRSARSLLSRVCALI